MSFALVVLTSVLASVEAKGGLFGAPPGDFDAWVLALYWQPEWIKRNCDSLWADEFSPSDYAAAYPSVHGLWPDYDPDLRDGYRYPEYCTSSEGPDYTICTQDEGNEICQPSSSTLSTFNVTERWLTYSEWYSWNDGSVSHEWSKHGGCTGWSQETYFQTVEDTYIRVAKSRGFDFLASNVGNTVDHADVVSAFANDLDGKQPAVVCDDGCILNQIYFAWTVEDDLTPGDPVDHSDADSCRSCNQEGITIPQYDGCGNAYPPDEQNTDPTSIPNPFDPAADSGSPTPAPVDTTVVIKNGLLGAPPGDFDKWVLALYWQPEWIVDRCDTTWAEQFSPADYAAAYLSVHGLWPDYDPETRDGYRYPEWCTGSGGADYSGCASNIEEQICAPSQSTLQTFNVSGRWQTYSEWYAWTDTASSHEWAKHGGCTGWTQQTYFDTLEDTYIRVAQLDSFAFLAGKAGESVLHDDIVNAFSSDLNGNQPAIICDSRCILSQIWFMWTVSPDLTPGDPVDHSDADTCRACLFVTVPRYDGCDRTFPPAEANTDPASITNPFAKDDGSSGGGDDSSSSEAIWAPIVAILCVLALAGAFAAYYTGRCNSSEEFKPLVEETKDHEIAMVENNKS